MTTNTAYSSPGAILVQLAGLLGGPAVWLAHFQANYALVQLACSSGSMLVHHAVSIVGLTLIAGSAWLAWKTWRTAGADVPSEKRAGPEDRSRLLGLLGMMTGALFFLVVLAQWIPTFLVHPCLE